MKLTKIQHKEGKNGSVNHVEVSSQTNTAEEIVGTCSALVVGSLLIVKAFDLYNKVVDSYAE